MVFYLENPATDGVPSVNMSPPKNPENPAARCDGCRFWLHPGGKMALIPAPGNNVSAVPFMQAMQQGMINETTRTTYVSNCARLPEWKPTPAEHWCFQFEPTGKI